MSAAGISQLTRNISELSLLPIPSPPPSDKKSLAIIWHSLLANQSCMHTNANFEEILGEVLLTNGRNRKGFFLLSNLEGSQQLKIHHLTRERFSESTLLLTSHQSAQLMLSNSTEKQISFNTFDTLFAALESEFGTAITPQRSGLEEALCAIHALEPKITKRLAKKMPRFRDAESKYKTARRDMQFLNSIKINKSTKHANNHEDYNRFTDNRPYDDNRVTVEGLPRFYLNASHVQLSHQEYILSEAPHRISLSNFWTAIIAKQSSLVVCLSLVNPYWENPPSQIILPNNQIWKLSTRSTELVRSSDITERSFTFCCGDKTHTINHVTVSSWQDQCAFSHESFTALLDTIDQKSTPEQPIWIHCTAGIGRAGTTAIAHNIRKKMRAPNNSIPCHIRHEVLVGRMQRTMLVQTEEQLAMIYDVCMAKKVMNCAQPR